LTFYEGMFLLDPADAAHNWEELKNYVTDMVTRHGGEILYTERWPDRKLAYEIKGRRKGTYFLTYFKADGGAVAPLRREAQLSERILRVLVLKNDRALEEIEKRREAQQKSAAPPEVAPADSAPADSAPAGDETGDFVEDGIVAAGEGAAVSEEAPGERETEEKKEVGESPEAENDSVSPGGKPSAEDAEEEKRSESEA